MMRSFIPVEMACQGGDANETGPAGGQALGGRCISGRRLEGGDQMLNVLGKTARWCTLGLEGLGLGFPGHDIQQGCVLLPTGILITVLHVAKAVADYIVQRWLQ